MKRFYKLLGITALVAAIATGLAGCPNDGGPGGGGSISFSDLIGTWKNDSNPSKIIQFGTVAKNYGIDCISIGGAAILDGSPASTIPYSGLWAGMVDGYIGALADGFRVALEGGKLRITNSTGSTYGGLDGLYTKQ
jgi:hypothetical protein